jgi:uncharacterized protein (TIGR02118 family)
MSVSYLVFYRGRAKDQQSFIDRYRETHVPILKRFPGIQNVSLLTPLDWQDIYPVNPGGFTLIVQMQFASVEQLDVALGSLARDEARKDFEKFPPFDGEVWHQAMNMEERCE